MGTIFSALPQQRFDVNADPSTSATHTGAGGAGGSFTTEYNIASRFANGRSSGHCYQLVFGGTLYSGVAIWARLDPNDANAWYEVVSGIDPTQPSPINVFDKDYAEWKFKVFDGNGTSTIKLVLGP